MNGPGAPHHTLPGPFQTTIAASLFAPASATEYRGLGVSSGSGTTGDLGLILQSIGWALAAEKATAPFSAPPRAREVARTGRPAPLMISHAEPLCTGPALLREARNVLASLPRSKDARITQSNKPNVVEEIGLAIGFVLASSLLE